MNCVRITYPDINNGTGFRVTIWISGCTHKCIGCHNVWLNDYSIGEPIENYLCETFRILEKPYIKGITFSGGDPLDQDEESLKQLLSFIKGIKKVFPDKDIWIYTGCIYEKLNEDKTIKEILDYCDVLVDGPFIESEKDLSLPFRGSRNQRIIYLKHDVK